MSRIKNMLCLVTVCVLACGHSHGNEVAARRAELEACAKTFDLCEDLDAPAPIPPPIAIKNKYNLTEADLLADIRWLSQKYGVSETNAENRLCREQSVLWLGIHGNTNDLPWLSTIMHNPADYAQPASIRASVGILRHSAELIPLARSILTNEVSFSSGLRGRTNCLLLGLCEEGKSDLYINDPSQHARIAAFFLERAAIERTSPLLADSCACRLNPSYRHSQQRRDNLAAARPPNLTGKPAELYDAAQADAAQSD